MLGVVDYCYKFNEQCLASTWIGWMDDLGIFVTLTVFQSYQDDGWVIMKGCAQRNPVYN